MSIIDHIAIIVAGSGGKAAAAAMILQVTGQR